MHFTSLYFTSLSFASPFAAVLNVYVTIYVSGYWSRTTLHTFTTQGHRTGFTVFWCWKKEKTVLNFCLRTSVWNVLCTKIHARTKHFDCYRVTALADASVWFRVMPHKALGSSCLSQLVCNLCMQSMWQSCVLFWLLRVTRYSGMNSCNDAMRTIRRMKPELYKENRRIFREKKWKKKYSLSPDHHFLLKI